MEEIVDDFIAFLMENLLLYLLLALYNIRLIIVSVIWLRHCMQTKPEKNDLLL